MKEVFVIEKMVALGIWELFSATFYTEEIKAIDNCLRVMKTMQETDKNFCARVTKLQAV